VESETDNVTTSISGGSRAAVAAHMKSKLECHRHVAIQRTAEVQKLKVELCKLGRSLASQKLDVKSKNAKIEKLQASVAREQKAKLVAEQRLAKKGQEVINLKRLLAEYADLLDWKRSAARARVTINTTVARRAGRYLHDLGEMA
jgi:hypothetical protein